MKDVDRFKLIKQINKPEDLKNIENLDELCSEIREKIIDIVSNNGGHLASNLGVVELSVVLHKVFCGQEDRVIWDVGHQCYAHKMLTGRFDDIDTMRTEGGLSGFPNRKESEYDVFTSGHSSASISGALGYAYSNLIKGNNAHTVTVIGDGALTGGLAYEGLNNAGRFKKNFVVVLNDNKMSISHNVGAISRYLTYMRIRPSYRKMKDRIENILNKIPVLGHIIANILKKIKTVFRAFLYNTNIFEDMGFLYYGPIDGHDTNKLIKVFNRVKELKRPVFVHVVTTKGKGYSFAEQNPKDFHGMPKFDVETGNAGLKGESFSKIFGEEICNIAESNDKICAITAAMKVGTGLDKFAKKFKSRFFDVGIAEEHAVTFAGGLAAGGMIPIVAVYSSFLQRSYDQIIHDVAVQGTKVVFAVDRAGFTGDDGETHQGIFDVPFLNSIPNIKIFAPSFFDELKGMFNDAMFKSKGACAVRYPRGAELYKPVGFNYTGKDFDILESHNSDILIVTYGRIFSNAVQAMEKLKHENNLNCSILKLNVIKPINLEAIKKAFGYKSIFFFEESVKSGGVGERFGEKLLEENFKGKYTCVAVDNVFVKHASVDSQIKRFSLDCDGIVNKILMGNDK